MSAAPDRGVNVGVGEDGFTFSGTQHPHEPEIPVALDEEGRCRICTLLVRIDRLRDEVERRAAENARLYDGIAALITSIYAVYERAQGVARKEST